MTGATGKADGMAWIAGEVAAGRQPGNADVRNRWGVSERTARGWLRDAGITGSRNGSRPRRQPATLPATAAGNGSAPGPATPTGNGNRQPTRRPADDRQRSGARLAMAVTGAGLVAVVAAPVAISARSLAGWGREALGLVDGWEWLVPLPLDGAALACVGLALHATLRGDAPGLARVLVWVLAAASSAANWRHGTTVSPDAAVFFASMPLLAALLLDLVLRRVRHAALGGLGALERPLARYRAARWLVAPRETWRAWRTAVREGITDPTEALARAAASRARHSVTASQDRPDAGEPAVTRHSSGAAA